MENPDSPKKGRGRPPGSSNKDKGGFARYNPAKWEGWMTTLCIKSNAGFSNSELAVEFEITETHVSNLLCSDRAKIIRDELKKKLIEAGTGDLNELRVLASKRVKEILEDDSLRTNAPVQMANIATRVLQMTFPTSSGSSKEKGDVNVTINQQTNLNQNVMAVNPEYMQRIAEGLEKANRVKEIHAGAFVSDVKPETGGDLVSPSSEARTLNKKVG